MDYRYTDPSHPHPLSVTYLWYRYAIYVPVCTYMPELCSPFFAIQGLIGTAAGSGEDKNTEHSSPFPVLLQGGGGGACMQLHPGFPHCSASAVTLPQPALKRLSRCALVASPNTWSTWPSDNIYQANYCIVLACVRASLVF